MTDLHTHLLPGMDDGPRTFDESMQLVEMELDDGVDTIAVTPHFNFEYHKLAEFLEKREKQSEALQRITENAGLSVTIIEGAEVYLSQWITVEQRIKALCYQNSNCMLIELPEFYLPDWAHQVLCQLKLRGITPIIAHAERYLYFQKDIDLLRSLTRCGCLVQINADSIIGRGTKRRRQAFKLIKSGLVQFVASDTHSVLNRPPRLGAAMHILCKKVGWQAADILEQNQSRLCSGEKFLATIL